MHKGIYCGINTVNIITAMSGYWLKMFDFWEPHSAMMKNCHIERNRTQIDTKTNRYRVYMLMVSSLFFANGLCEDDIILTIGLLALS